MTERRENSREERVDEDVAVYKDIITHPPSTTLPNVIPAFISNPHPTSSTYNPQTSVHCSRSQPMTIELTAFPSPILILHIPCSDLSSPPPTTIPSSRNHHHHHHPHYIRTLHQSRSKSPEFFAVTVTRMEIAVFGEQTFMQNMWSGVVGDFQGEEEARLSETAWRVFSVGSEEFGYEDESPLRTIARPLARSDISILYQSAAADDYFFVKEDEYDRVLSIAQERGWLVDDHPSVIQTPSLGNWSTIKSPQFSSLSSIPITLPKTPTRAVGIATKECTSTNEKISDTKTKTKMLRMEIEIDGSERRVDDEEIVVRPRAVTMPTLKTLKIGDTDADSAIHEDTTTKQGLDSSSVLKLDQQDVPQLHPPFEFETGDRSSSWNVYGDVTGIPHHTFLLPSTPTRPRSIATISLSPAKIACCGLRSEGEMEWWDGVFGLLAWPGEAERRPKLRVGRIEHPALGLDLEGVSIPPPPPSPPPPDDSNDFPFISYIRAGSETSLATELPILRALFPGEKPEHLSCTDGLLEIWDDDDEWPALGSVSVPAIDLPSQIMAEMEVDEESSEDERRGRSKTRVKSWLGASSLHLTSNSRPSHRRAVDCARGDDLKRHSYPAFTRYAGSWDVRRADWEDGKQLEMDEILREVRRCIQLDMRGVARSEEGVYHLDKSGVLLDFSDKLQQEGVKMLYASTFHSANLLVEAIATGTAMRLLQNS